MNERPMCMGFLSSKSKYDKMTVVWIHRGHRSIGTASCADPLMVLIPTPRSTLPLNSTLQRECRLLQMDPTQVFHPLRRLLLGTPPPTGRVAVRVRTSNGRIVTRMGRIVPTERFAGEPQASVAASILAQSARVATEVCQKSLWAARQLHGTPYT